MSKGSNRRPLKTDPKKFEKNWDRVFRKRPESEGRRPSCPASDGSDLPEQERTRCEVWTRVMGYHRPVDAFNPGKKAEHAERVHFRTA